MQKLCSLVFFVLCFLTGSISTGCAEEDDYSASFLSAFPRNGIYNITVIGDEFAEDLHEGILKTLNHEKNVEVNPKLFSLTGLIRTGGEEKLNLLDDFLKIETPNIVLIMMGASDRIITRDTTGKRLIIGTLEWRSEYRKKIDNVLKIFKRNKIAVYIVGLPAFRNSEANEYVRTLNDIFRESTYLNGMKYIDIYAGFLDETGNYSAWGPDLNGKIIKIREADGQRFTKAGNLMLGNFIERELRRDIKEAEAIRLEPLAGNETEQIKVNPDKPAIKNADIEEKKSSQFHRNQELKNFLGEDIASDNEKVSVKLSNKSGQSEINQIEIQRPSLSSSIVALVAQKESDNKNKVINKKLSTFLNNGLIAFNTITLPATELNNDQIKKVSPTQSSFYKFLIKGERLSPKEGRGDDLRWPISD